MTLIWILLGALATFGLARLAFNSICLALLHAEKDSLLDQTYEWLTSQRK